MRAARSPARRAPANEGAPVILLWGVPGDPPFDVVRAALLRRGAPTLVVDQRRVAAVSLEVEIGARLAGILRVEGKRFALDDLAGIYLRPQDLAAGFAAAANAHRVALDDLLLVVAELAPGVVLNRPDAMAANGSKPYQYGHIRRVGFRVPETLVTTSPEAAREFVARHGRVIYKSVSGVRSIVGELREPDAPRLDDVRWCPTQLQERIAGTDVRVHVVGETLFACEVRSDVVDYRYAHQSGHGVAVTDCELPDACAERCLALARATGLPLAGIDLRRTADGDWYCFEVNPSPGFTYYEQMTGAPIGEAVAELLASQAGAAG